MCGTSWIQVHLKHLSGDSKAKCEVFTSVTYYQNMNCHLKLLSGYPQVISLFLEGWDYEEPKSSLAVLTL